MKIGAPGLHRTLEDLEGDRWGEPEYPSHLVTECHRLRKVPLREFTVENLRIMIGQNIGSRHLVPIALERLETDPLAEGDFCTGDLLCSVLSLPPEFWIEHPALRDRAVAIAERAVADPDATKHVRKAYERFRA